MEDQDLEILQERLKRQRMQELLQNQSQNPNGEIAMNLAGGFIQNMQDFTNNNMNAARYAVGKDPISYAKAENPADKVLNLQRQKQMERRKAALEDVDLLDKFEQRKKLQGEKEEALKREELIRKQNLSKEGYEIGEDGMPAAVSGGLADLQRKKILSDMGTAGATRDLDRRYKEAQIAKLNADAAGGNGETGRLSTFVPGVGQALTKEDAKNLKDATVMKSKLDRQLQEMIDLRQNKGTEFLDRAAVARGQQLSKDILLTYKNLQKLGVLSKSDEDIINAIIPADPLAMTFSSMTGIGEDPILSNLTKFKADNQADYENNLNARLRPGQVAQNGGFPRQVRKDGQVATVSNAQELQEAAAEGWN